MDHKASSRSCSPQRTSCAFGGPRQAAAAISAAPRAVAQSVSCQGLHAKHSTGGLRLAPLLWSLFGLTTPPNLASGSWRPCQARWRLGGPTLPQNLDDPLKGLWPIYHIGGYTAQFYGSLGPYDPMWDCRRYYIVGPAGVRREPDCNDTRTEQPLTSGNPLHESQHKLLGALSKSLQTLHQPNENPKKPHVRLPTTCKLKGRSKYK